MENKENKNRRTTWRTKGRILFLKKEMPIVRVYHVKRDNQYGWDNSPFFHGSNGTYAENTSPFWSLNIKIKRPSYEVPEPLRTNIDVHDYITSSLMPKLGWERITQNRLDWLNETLSGKEMELETSDVNEAALYRTFIPIGFKSWGDYLDYVIDSKINCENNEQVL